MRATQARGTSVGASTEITAGMRVTIIIKTTLATVATEIGETTAVKAPGDIEASCFETAVRFTANAVDQRRTVRLTASLFTASLCSSASRRPTQRLAAAAPDEDSFIEMGWRGSIVMA